MRTSDSCSFDQFTELFDPHIAIWKNRPNLKCATHRFDEVGQRADVHVCSSFEFRHRSLAYTENPGEMLLCQITSCAEFVQGHLFNHLLSFCFASGAGCWRHLCLKFFEALRHLSFSFLS